MRKLKVDICKRNLILGAMLPLNEGLSSVLSPQHESVVVRSARIVDIDHQCHQLGVIGMHVRSLKRSR